MSSPVPREREQSNRERRTTTSTTSPIAAKLERVTGESSRRERDRGRTQRERQRSMSPSRQSTMSDTGSVQQRERTSHRTKPRRRRRSVNRGSSPGSTEMMAWSRGGKSPGIVRNTSRDDVASRQLKQLAPPLVSGRDNVEDEFDDLAARRGSQLSTDDGSVAMNKAGGGSKATKRTSRTAAIASSNDIDAVIAQFRDQCDVHLATLLELKNNITTTEKEVVVCTEKDKEFQQVRQWYSALAEKHTKLQKEHQALQAEHVKLQERYMNLKRAGSLSDSFVANFAGDGEEPKKEKKEKKEKKSMGDIVWSRAVKPTGKAAGKVAGTVAGKVYVNLSKEDAGRCCLLTFLSAGSVHRKNLHHHLQ